MARQLHLGAFMRPVSIHTGAWRYPGATRDGNFNLKAISHYIRKLEQAKFDYFFMADHLGVLNLPREALMRSHTVTSYEPFTLLSALAGATSQIGLVATASTTYDEPFHVARRFASLDHISGGRAGWNVVTTSNPDSSRNFGMDTQPDHAERYARAHEFYEVVTGLWDSFADNAFVMDAESGIYFDPDRMHTLDYKGERFSVRGPLNIARPVQGWPVIFQAGASDPGRQLAAETAEVVFAAESTLEGSKSYYDDVKGRAVKAGRNPDLIKIMPAVFLVVGDTVEEAKAKRAKLDSLVHYDSGIHSLSGMLGHDVTGYDPDGPLPEIPESNASKSSRRFMVELARAENLTIRELAAKAGSYGGLAFVGTPETIADEMQNWLEQGACDGFTAMFPYLPEGLEDFTDKVVPELQARGLFRSEYEGDTLRDHLGLPRPANAFFPDE
ncbi:Coenzyme [Aurantiacibacter atlanticus]|uniref:Coenzyme n=1 Tax=Aurantiacibacter atlanticus TaxID=1648404 RepID=A0A0H4W0A6_9SPHN|nr:LLM class flavin-dependent oxidoreductase [Aurantiacibacter atlanticus]AKQ42913.1 Coenzyme [Aurantiacibacter atlanticus]MDF1834388.1 LLM class flavin-dependent oxidoreductase [Alteraurantiacibacter sp. bin_em_oilr2.035]